MHVMMHMMHLQFASGKCSVTLTGQQNRQVNKIDQASPLPQKERCN